MISGSFEERDLQLKASYMYASLPPCTYYMLPCNWRLVFGKETCEIKKIVVFRHHASSCLRLACVPNVSELFVFEKYSVAIFDLLVFMYVWGCPPLHQCMYVRLDKFYLKP